MYKGSFDKSELELDGQWDFFDWFINQDIITMLSVVFLFLSLLGVFLLVIKLFLKDKAVNELKKIKYEPIDYFLGDFNYFRLKKKKIIKDDGTETNALNIKLAVEGRSYVYIFIGLFLFIATLIVFIISMLWR